MSAEPDLPELERRAGLFDRKLWTELNTLRKDNRRYVRMLEDGVDPEEPEEAAS